MVDLDRTDPPLLHPRDVSRRHNLSWVPGWQELVAFIKGDGYDAWASHDEPEALGALGESSGGPTLKPGDQVFMFQVVMVYLCLLNMFRYWGDDVYTTVSKTVKVL